jgi:hypothetical protein
VSLTAIHMNEKSVLQLNGHSIDIDQIGVAAVGHQATIQGPGALRGADHGVALLHKSNVGPVKVSVTGGVDMHDNDYGIVTGEGNKTRLTLDDVSFVGNEVAAISGPGYLDCNKVTIKGQQRDDDRQRRRHLRLVDSSQEQQPDRQQRCRDLQLVRQGAPRQLDGRGQRRQLQHSRAD